MDFLSPIYLINIVKTGLKYQFLTQIGFLNVNSVFVVKNDKNDGTFVLQIKREICILLIHIHIFTQKLRGTMPQRRNRFKTNFVCFAFRQNV